MSGYNNAGGISLLSPGNVDYFFGSSIGTPLTFTLPSCGAPAPAPVFLYCPTGFSQFYLPAVLSPLGLSVAYGGDARANLQADLVNPAWPFPSIPLNAANSVITSLNLDGGQFNASWIQTNQRENFDFFQQIVAPSNLQAAATQEGAHSRVITAISSVDGVNLIYFSYGWSADPSTLYDSMVSTATFESAPTVATSLASNGYIITAIGGSLFNDSLYLVGTRVHGDTMPRPFVVESGPGSVKSTEISQPGYAVTGTFSNAQGTITTLGER